MVHHESEIWSILNKISTIMKMAESQVREKKKLQSPYFSFEVATYGTQRTCNCASEIVSHFELNQKSL